ncbi:MAG: hypothetical protein KDK11_15890 [Maritimibacter sp.]|nr:hypothetical protein [Maritimibacter sp.]
MTDRTAIARPIDPAVFADVPLRDLYRFKGALDTVGCEAEDEDAAALAMSMAGVVERAAVAHPAADPAESLLKFLLTLEHGVPLMDEDLVPMIAEARRVLALDLGETAPKPD